jgi:hypothetical protein
MSTVEESVQVYFREIGHSPPRLGVLHFGHCP